MSAHELRRHAWLWEREAQAAKAKRREDRAERAQLNAEDYWDWYATALDNEERRRNQAQGI